MQFTNALALDIGDARIGVARASSVARIAQPIGAIPVDGQQVESLRQLIEAESIDLLVIGLPRSLKGDETLQTHKVQAVGDELKQLGLPIIWQDEALTSVQAEAEAGPADKARIDALAATYILEDFLREQPA